MDYKVYWYDPTSETPGFVLYASSTQPSYQTTFIGLSAGFQYQFTLVATNIIGDSVQSVPAPFIAASVPGLPSPPLKVSSTDTPSITIDWAEPSYNGGSPILSYNIYVDDVLVDNVVAGSLLHTETDALTLGESFVFKVSAINVIGEGALSTGTTLIAAREPYKPDAPTKVSAAANFIEVAWISPNTGGTPIRGHRLYKNGALVVELDENTLQYTITQNL